MTTRYRHTVEDFMWGDDPRGPRHPGVRINRGPGWVYIPDTEILELANTLADYLTNNNNR